MSAGLIREMQVNISKYGKTNVTTLLMVQAVEELQGANAELDRLKAANAELLETIRTIAEFDQWEWSDREAVRQMRCNARAALTKHQKEQA